MDNRTEAERRYDATKLSRPRDVWEEIQNITDDPANNGRDNETRLTDDEIAILLATTPVIPSRDEAHRQQRWDAIIEQVASFDEDEQNEVIQLLEAIERHFDARRAAR